MRGRIVRGIAGTYSVDAGGREIYECRARGVFRKEGIKPLVGDCVEIEVLDEENHFGSITGLLPRRSELIRPAVANVDQALVIFAVASPRPNFNLLDRFLIRMEQQKISCLICFNKQDLDREEAGERYRQIYEGCGYRTFLVSALNKDGLEELKAQLKGRTTVLAGPSGVGKSSVVNELQQRVVMETGQISAKIERGKHTTRHTELIAVGYDTYILDTPGFSSLDLPSISREELWEYYPEFKKHAEYCKFSGCSHTKEPVCGVKAAVEEGAVERLRYENYRLFYEELDSRQRFK